MDKKYEMTNEVIEFEGRILHRIRALKDFGDVKKGDLGGFIGEEKNLSQEENAWVYNNAKVCDSAVITNNAIIKDNAKVCGCAMINDNAIVLDDAYVSGKVVMHGSAIIANSAKVEGCAKICDQAVIEGAATVKDDALIRDYATILGNAQVFENTCVEGGARVCGNAKVYGESYIADNTIVKGNAEVYDCGRVRHEAIIEGSGKVSQEQIVSYGITKTDLSKDLAASIKVQCNLPVINNKVIAYKLVKPNFASFYDKNFKYEVGKVAEVENCDMTTKSCAAGLHFSNLTYWEKDVEEFICLEAEIDLDDVITVQEGKIRCKRARILRAFTMS